MVSHTYPIFNIHQQISRATQDRQAATPVPPLPLLGGCCNKTHPPASLDPKNRIIKDVSQGWLSTSETTSDDTGYVNILYHPSRTTTRALIHSFIHWSKPPEGIQSNPPYPSLSRPLFLLNFSWRLALQGFSPHCFIDATTAATNHTRTHRQPTAGCVLNGKGPSPRLPPH